MLFSRCSPPDRLEKVLLGFAAQDRCEFDVVVAEVGGGKASAIEPMRPHRRMPASHVSVEVRGVTA